MGYVGAVIPFAFAMAALWAGRLDAVWTLVASWTLAAWCCLTFRDRRLAQCGHTTAWLGRLVVLGPCGNASFMPWLGGVALLHSLAVTESAAYSKLDDYVGDFHLCFKFIGAFGTWGSKYLGSFICRRSPPRSVYPW